MDAYVTVKYKISNFCTQEDLEIENMVFEEMVKSCIDSEGLFSIVDNPDGKILKIEKSE